MSDENLELLTEQEAAQLIRMSSHFLRRNRGSLSADKLPFIRLGSAIRYRKSDLLKWLESRVNMPHPKNVCVNLSCDLVDSNLNKRYRKRERLTKDLPVSWLPYANS